MRPERVEGLSTSSGDIAATPVPAIQRRLAAVPDVRPRKAGFPPPPMVTLPVVAREVATSRTVAAQTPTPPPSAPPLSGPVTLSTAQPGPATDLETNSLLAEAEPITVLPGLESPTPQLAAEAEPLAYDETLPASDDLARGPETVRPGGQPTVQQSMVGHTPPRSPAHLRGPLRVGRSVRERSSDHAALSGRQGCTARSSDRLAGQARSHHGRRRRAGGTDGAAQRVCRPDRCAGRRPPAG